MGALPKLNLYRPTSGAEGADFTSRWCQWKLDGNWPHCTAFEPSDPADQPLDPRAVVCELNFPPLAMNRENKGDQRWPA